MKVLIHKSPVHLLSPPGVFGCVETGQVFVLFEDIHLLENPASREQNKETINKHLKQSIATVSRWQLIRNYCKII